jgi:hypothetical protein
MNLQDKTELMDMATRHAQAAMLVMARALTRLNQITEEELERLKPEQAAMMFSEAVKIERQARADLVKLRQEESLSELEAFLLTLPPEAADAIREAVAESYPLQLTCDGKDARQAG